MTRASNYTRWIVGPLVAAAALAMATTGASGDTAPAPAPVPGSQGIDTSLPMTPSAVTIQGRGAFTNLTITVNQTASLSNQAVSITWTGGTPTRQGPGRFGAQFLQIMQCWGDDDGTVAGNPGPPPEQCVQGAAAGTYGGVPGNSLPNGFAASRIISRSDWKNFNKDVGFLETSTTNVWRPFRSVTGKVINSHTDPNFNPQIVGGNFWLNDFFSIITTNEIAAAVTGADGRGAELFEVLTGQQSAGLGCGRKSQPVSGGDPKIPQCWLVIVPRGAPTAENVGTPFVDGADEFGVYTSPLSPTAWANRIAIPLSFKQVDSPCAIGAEERRVAGTELMIGAISSWQPALCTSGSGPPYAYAPVSDASARQQLASPVAGGPGMVAIARPLAASTASSTNPVVYAPIGASGIAVGFNIERIPALDAPAATQLISGVRVAELNLTPRLVAKLLTQSYTSQIRIGGGQPNYEWAKKNPVHLGLDPDFLQFNPEFKLLQIQASREFGGLQVVAGTTDAAQLVWEWIFADPEASAWLAGAPDQWGMKVNSVYATQASANSTGIAFGEPMPNTFPKNEPYCYQAPNIGTNPPVVPPPLCITDWMPSARSMSEVARVVRTAFDGARIGANPFATAPSDVWKRALPQGIGTRSILSLTDTNSAARFGLQTARLSRAGDNGATRRFIAANAAGLAAGVTSMRPRSEASVLEPAWSTNVADAYPLTSITYAAIRPLSLDQTARDQYAALLDYAAGPGQVVGTDVGQLPAGYLPLPAALATQTRAAAVQVRTMQPPAPTTTTSTTTVPPTTSAPAVSRPVSRPVSTRPPVTVSGPVVDTTLAVLDTTPPTSVEDSTTTTTEVSTTVAPTTTLPSVDQQGPATTVAPAVTPAAAPTKARYVMAGMGIVSLLSALGALEITKRARRANGSSLEGSHGA